MNQAADHWQKLRDEYLKQVEAALGHVSESIRTEILADVTSHLKQRFDELAAEDRGPERLRQIIAEMGPATEYAELLLGEEGLVRPPKPSSKAKRVGIVLALVLPIVFCLPFLQNTLRTYGKDAQMLSHRAWQLWRSGQYKQARQYFRLSLRKDPQSPSAWNGLGWSLFHLGDFNRAEEALLQCIQINDQFAGALNGLGYIAQHRGFHAQAIDYWQQAIAISPGATASLSGLGELYLEQGQYAEAVEVYEQWLRVDPANPDATAGLQKSRQMLKRDSAQDGSS